MAASKIPRLPKNCKPYFLIVRKVVDVKPITSAYQIFYVRGGEIRNHTEPWRAASHNAGAFCPFAGSPPPPPMSRSKSLAPDVTLAAPAASVDARTRRFQQKREAVLDAAALCFNARGVRGATLADIAASVGLVTNSVTYYYRKKEDLAAACFLRAIGFFDGLAARAAQVAPGDQAAAQRVRAFVRGYAELLANVEEGRHPPQVLFNDLRALPSPHLEQVHDAYRDLFRRVRALLMGAEAQQFSRDELNARTHAVLSLVHWLPGWIGRHEATEYGRIAERLCDLMLNGIAARGAHWGTVEGEEGWTAGRSTAGAQEPFLQAATALVNEQGYRGASVDKISARLHLTKGAFYHHNDNKQDLISACFERSFMVLRETLARAEQSPHSGWSRAGAVARVLGRFQLSAEGPLLRMSSTSALPEADDRVRVRRSMLRLAERMGSLVVDGMVDGSIRPLDPTVAAQAIFALVNAAFELPRWVPKAGENEVADLLMKPLFLGLLSPSEAR